MPKSKVVKSRKARRNAVPRSLARLVRKWGSFEVRLNDDKSVDEIVADHIASLHVEQMDDGLWWMRLDSTGGQSIVVHFHTKRNAAIAVNVESENGELSEGFGVIF